MLEATDPGAAASAVGKLWAMARPRHSRGFLAGGHGTPSAFAEPRHGETAHGGLGRPTVPSERHEYGDAHTGAGDVAGLQVEACHEVPAGDLCGGALTDLG